MTILSQRRVTYGVRDTAVDTSGVELTHPVGGMTTQEDANHHFDERMQALEAGGGSPLPDLDGGSY